MDPMKTRDNVESAGRVARYIAQLKRFHSTEDISGVSSMSDNDGFAVVNARYNKKPRRHQQQTHAQSSNQSNISASSAVDEAIEFVASQGRSLKSNNSMQPVSNPAGKLQSTNESTMGQPELESIKANADNAIEVAADNVAGNQCETVKLLEQQVDSLQTIVLELKTQV